MMLDMFSDCGACNNASIQFNEFQSMRTPNPYIKFTRLLPRIT